MSDTYYVIGEDTLAGQAAAIKRKRGYAESKVIKVADYADEIDGISGTLEQLLNPNTPDGSVAISSPTTAIPRAAFGYDNSSYSNPSELGKKIGGNCSFPNVLTIGELAFVGCSGITGMYIPKISAIGGAAFRNCTSLKTVGDISSLTSLGGAAFQGCAELEGNFNLPGITSSSINQIFKGCSKVTSVKLPNCSSTYSTEAFQNCSSLISADIGKTTITSNTNGLRIFDNCPTLRNVIYRHTTKHSYYASAWSGTTDKSQITIIVPADLVSTYEADSGWSGAGFAGFAALTTTLTIGEDSYTCNEGETWADFVNSVNNTDGLVVVGNMVYNAAKTAYVTNGGKAVYPFDIITGSTYALTAI